MLSRTSSAQASDQHTRKRRCQRNSELRKEFFHQEYLECRWLLSTSTWVGASGAWTTASNWSGGVVPGSASAVVINEPGSVTVSLSGSASVASLALTGAKLTVSGGTLAVAATVSNSGTLTVNAGSILNVGGAYTETSTGNLTLASGAAGAGISNLVQNPGFESPTGGGDNTPPDDWAQYGATYVSTDYVHSGSESLLEYGDNSGVYESFSVSPGVSYSASVYAFTPSGNRLTGTETAAMQFVFSDSDGNTIDAPQGAVTALNSSSATNTWIHSTISAVTAPSNAATVTLYLQVYDNDNSSGGLTYFDDVQFGPPIFSTAAVTTGSVSNSGVISIGAGDTLTDSGTLTLTTTATLDFLLGGPPSESFSGDLTAGGAATLAGTVGVTLTNGYSPTISDGFSLLTYVSETGAFTAATLPSASGYVFTSALNPTYYGISAVPTALTTTINATSKIANSTANVVGANIAYFDDLLTTSQTQQMIQAAGLSLLRFPGGSAADDYHFNVQENLNDSASNTIPGFAQLITQVSGTGVITVDYGSGSPQEAEAEFAFLEGSTSDTTNIGTGIEWNDSAGAWQNVNWGTVSYWAGLRASAPLGTDDGLNFLRINQPTPFSDIKYWEIGNELYYAGGVGGEIDHHGTAGPSGVSTGSQGDPATYAAFTASFIGFDAADSKLPVIKVGIDSGDPTGSDGWTPAVISYLYHDGYAPGFISDHSYMQAPGTESDSFLLNDTVSDSGSVRDWSTRYADYETMLKNVMSATQASGVQVLATEFNSNPGVEGKQMTSLVNGLFVADSIGSLASSGYGGGLVWDFRNSWNTDGNNSPSLYGWREGGDEGIVGTDNDNAPPSTGPYVAYPSYFGEQISSHIMQNGGSELSVAGAYNELTVYSVLEANGHLDLMVINKNPDAALTDQFNITGFTPSGASQVWQYGEVQDYAQEESTNGAAALATSNPTIAVSGNNFSFSFPAYSMTVIDLSPPASPGNLTLSGPNYYVTASPTNAAQTLIYGSVTPTGTPVYNVANSSITSLTFTNLASLTIDDKYGNPVSSGTVTATGTAASLILTNLSTSSTTASVGSSQVSFNGTGITYSGFSTLAINGGLNGNTIVTQTAQPGASLTVSTQSTSNNLNIQAGTYSFVSGSNPGSGLSITVGVAAGNSAASVSFGSAGIGQPSVAQVDVGALTVYSDATVTLGARATNAGLNDHLVLVVSSLNLSSGAINLNDNDMIVQTGTLAAVTTQLARGWSGAAAGLYSAIASANTTHLTAVGSMVAGTSYTVFDGVPVTAGNILLKYTYLGDSNLDGIIDGSDYSRVDSGYLVKMTGWNNGDFNYDGVVNGSDYTLIDNAYNQQASTLNSASFTLKTLASFNSSSSGGYFYSGLTINQNTLYGETYYGGSGGGGTVFSESTSGGSPVILSSFSNDIANEPFYSSAALVLSGTTLYGASGGDPTNGFGGDVFSLSTSGGSPRVIATFSTAANTPDGTSPQARLTLSPDGKTLYGTTLQGGTDNAGTVFSVNVSTGAITLLATFTGGNEAACRSGLILSGSTLYGTTQGAAGYNGTVFSLPITGGTPQVLTTFNGSNGSAPISDLLLAGNTLYGTASEGGPGGQGTVFSLPITGGNPTTLASFNGTNGGDIGGGLLLIGSTLYGDAYGVGTSTNQYGTVFSVPITGGNATTIASFSGSPGNGANPICDLVADSSGNLYGTTAYGGVNDDGTIFSLSPIAVP